MRFIVLFCGMTIDFLIALKYACSTDYSKNMATKKGGGSTKNGRDSNPKYLGIKINDGEQTSAGAVLVRQRGTSVLPGVSVGMGKDHTLFALKSGTVRFGRTRSTHFDNETKIKKIVSVV